MTAQSPSREKVQWLHDTATEFASVGMKLTMNAEELLPFTNALLAAHDQEPVAYMYRDNLHTDARLSLEPRFGNWSPEDISEYEISETPLYDHPAPAPAVPDEMTIKDACKFVQDMRIFDDVVIIVMRTWNACRAAMLNGGTG